MRTYAVYGANGFGREVMPVLNAQLSSESSGDSEKRLVFVDDDASTHGKVFNGYRCLSFSQLLDSTPKEDGFVTIAIADPGVRRKLAGKCRGAGLRPFSVVSPSHVRLDEVSIREGAILCAQTMITSNASIGSFFHCNIYSYVAHDCVIGDFVTFAPRVCCNGRVVVEDDAYIGTGALLKQGTPDAPLVIGKGAVVGMGAVVTKNVEPGAVVVGNPARPLRR